MTKDENKKLTHAAVLKEGIKHAKNAKGVLIITREEKGRYSMHVAGISRENLAFSMMIILKELMK